ncbi:hypothetical protein pv_131 [Pithovirus sibericum]|uniref:Transmembrane protein n=1 Tax=Pithovirus sibericum TaxID=1450746 RepID=W5S4M8_9VIRU|nr:hypothetical protein pv_131 [Pithovirus sibericum]AHH01698.1 hypothetical protein pv_131 [Pithovirus sibericum]
MKNPSYFFVTSYKIWVFKQKLFLLDLGEIITNNIEFHLKFRHQIAIFPLEFHLKFRHQIAIFPLEFHLKTQYYLLLFLLNLAEIIFVRIPKFYMMLQKSNLGFSIL